MIEFMIYSEDTYAKNDVFGYYSDSIWVGNFDKCCKFIGSKVEISKKILKIVPTEYKIIEKFCYLFSIGEDYIYVRFPNLNEMPRVEYLKNSRIMGGKGTVITIEEYIIKNIIE